MNECGRQTDDARVCAVWQTDGSEVTTMTAPEHFERWLAGIRENHVDLACVLRSLVVEAEWGLGESLNWGNPAFGKDGGLRIYIGDQRNYMHLGFYNGAKLTNADGLVEGTGKNLRHIKVRAIGDPPIDSLRVHVAESLALEPYKIP